MTIEGAIIDLDGTVYRGGELVPGADGAIRRLREAGVSVLFVSNNPTKAPAAFAADLEALGVPADPEDVLTSAVVTREYLHDHHRGDAVFPIAEGGVLAQFPGVDLVDDPAAADVLLVGIDRAFGYDDMTDALAALADGETAFVGTDPDVTIPTGNGAVPGSGAIIRAVEGVTGAEPDRVLGKPSPETADAARSRLGVDPAACLVVGDRLDTDVALGVEVGARTALVLTGAHDEAALERSAVRPDHVLDSLVDVGEVL